MKCIHFNSSFLPLVTQSSRSHQFNTTKLLSLPRQKPSSLRRRMPTTTRAAITNSFILAVSTTVKGGDISVLLPTGAVLLAAYVIANFVVPYFMLKSQLEEASDNPIPEDDDTDDD